MIQSIWDIRIKRIPTIISLVGGGVGFILSICSGRTISDFLFACIPAAVCLLCSRLTNGAVGEGDAILLFAMGMVYPLAQMSQICITAYMIAAVGALVLMLFFHKKKDYEVPFVPFLQLGWLVEFVSYYGGIKE